MTPCADWVTLRIVDDRTLADRLDSWMKGFVTGLNFERAQREGSASGDLTRYAAPGYVHIIVDRYCASHPNDTLSDAMAEAVVELQSIVPPESSNGAPASAGQGAGGK